jgi:thymidine kinase
MAPLILFCGPMFSGKTEALLAIVRSAETSGKPVALLKPALDSRNPGEVVSHAGARHAAVDVENGEDILRAARGAEIVALDEAQFLQTTGVSALIDLAQDGVSVAVAGLDLDFRADPFLSVEELRRSADEVRLLSATCTRCGGQATRTQRLVRGLPAAYADPTIVLGGEETYQPRCERCYNAERAGI